MGKNNPRKLTIVFENRDFKNSAELLLAIAKAFRPGDVEIRVGSPPTESDAPTLADEQLETRAKEQTNKKLKKANANPPVAPDPKVARQKLRSRIKQLAQQGWGILAKVVPLAERVVKIISKIHGTFWN